MPYLKPVIADIYSGCGGFGLGAELAGFHTAVAVDIDSTLQSAYKLNFPNTRTITADLSLMEKPSWETLLSGQQVDGVIGGPPCQGYSRIGKNDINDPRRSLLHDFFRTVSILNPKFFVMENVEGLLDDRNRSELEKAISILSSQYKVLNPMIIDASDYGAPTKRRRAIVIGYDPAWLEELNPEEFFPNANNRTTIRDAIFDLPKPIEKTGDTDDFGWVGYPTRDGLSDYSTEMRKAPPSGLGWQAAKDRLRDNFVSGNFDTIHTDNVKKRFSNIQQGQTDKISRAKKLAWDGLSPTLRAGTGSDKGSYQSVRPIHPDEGRVITVREAARIQGFPDWFCFHPTKWHSFRMIGNSVSPLVSKSILSVMKGKMSESLLDLDPPKAYICV